jgi:two-component system sensor histidine kinase/response regulator
MLVVDDNDSARAILGSLLKEMTFEVDKVASGKEALAAVQAAQQKGQPYDVVFLDWQMPEMDGIETARRLRQAPGRPAPQVVLVTAHGREEVLRQAQQVGITQTLIKPVNGSLLFDAIMRLLGGQGAETDDAEQRRPRGGAETGKALDLSALQGVRLLLVEDNELNQEVARGLLADTGVIIDLAENGAIAVQKVAKTPYDVVLMDMQMPVMDGLEATRRIRADGRFAALPIVAMTANALEEDRKQCLAVGMNDHLAKPIEPELLWSTLLRWVTVSRQGMAAASPQNEAPSAAPQAVVEHQADPWYAVAGLNWQDGLRRASNKSTLYESLLRTFMRGQVKNADTLATLLAEGDRATAERQAHSLKGVAATVGAEAIEQRAAVVERGIRDGLPASRLAPEISALCQETHAVIDALAAAQGAASAAPTATAREDGDQAQQAAALERFKTLLAADDSDALEVLEQNEALLKGALGGKTFARVSSLAQDFDFPAALRLLNEGA